MSDQISVGDIVRHTEGGEYSVTAIREDGTIAVCQPTDEQGDAEDIPLEELQFVRRYSTAQPQEAQDIVDPPAAPGEAN